MKMMMTMVVVMIVGWLYFVVVAVIVVIVVIVVVLATTTTTTTVKCNRIRELLGQSCIIIELYLISYCNIWEKPETYSVLRNVVCEYLKNLDTKLTKSILLIWLKINSFGELLSTLSSDYLATMKPLFNKPITCQNSIINMSYKTNYFKLFYLNV